MKASKVEEKNKKKKQSDKPCCTHAKYGYKRECDERWREADVELNG